jgi:hypothetical protein
MSVLVRQAAVGTPPPDWSFQFVTVRYSSFLVVAVRFLLKIIRSWGEFGRARIPPFANVSIVSGRCFTNPGIWSRPPRDRSISSVPAPWAIRSSSLKDRCGSFQFVTCGLFSFLGQFLQTKVPPFRERVYRERTQAQKPWHLVPTAEGPVDIGCQQCRTSKTFTARCRFSGVGYGGTGTVEFQESCTGCPKYPDYGVHLVRWNDPAGSKCDGTFRTHVQRSPIEKPIGAYEPRPIERALSIVNRTSGGARKQRTPTNTRLAERSS